LPRRPGSCSLRPGYRLRRKTLPGEALEQRGRRRRSRRARSRACSTASRPRSTARPRSFQPDEDPCRPPRRC
jgi:hypothetical protein